MHAGHGLGFHEVDHCLHFVIDADSQDGERRSSDRDSTYFPAATAPLLAIDMYEPLYHMDYGASAARYIDAFFANIRWDAVSARVEAL